MSTHPSILSLLFRQLEKLQNKLSSELEQITMLLKSNASHAPMGNAVRGNSVTHAGKDASVCAVPSQTSSSAAKLFHSSGAERV